jgi:glucosamine-6-phosphate deaminase
VRLRLFPDKAALGAAAAEEAASAVRLAIAERGRARVVAATGASQFEFLAALVARTDVD